jgi:hypothetical protein
VSAWFERRPETRPLAVIAAILVILTLVASAMVLWPAGSSSSSSVSGSPEASLRNWAAAVQVFDFETADEYLSARVQSTGFSSMDVAMCGGLTGVDVGKASIDGTRATLAVTLHVTSFTGAKTTLPWTVGMVASDGVWKIDSALDANCQ